MKWYLSGPMSGHADLNFPAFQEAAEDLRSRGHEVVSPHEINPDLNADWFDCIIEDLQHVRGCTAMLMLKGWEDSYGARIEHLVAQKLQLHIEYEDDGTTD